MSSTTACGYKMNDGTIVPFKKLNIGDISPEHVEEMNNASASVWDVALLRNSIYTLKDEIKKDVAEQIDKLSESIIKHVLYCPVNPDGVKEIIYKEIESENVKAQIQKQLRDTAIQQVNKGSKIVKYAWRAIVVIFLIINIYLILKGKSPIQVTL